MGNLHKFTNIFWYYSNQLFIFFILREILIYPLYYLFMKLIIFFKVTVLVKLIYNFLFF